jgi:hypothetical protein
MSARNNFIKTAGLVWAAVLLSGCLTPGKRPVAGLLWPKTIGMLKANGITGPTLHLDYGQGDSQGNPAGVFMYFVPLISPEPVTATQTPGNTQRARVTTSDRRFSDATFTVKCDFEIDGQGCQMNIIDQEAAIRRQADRLKNGGTLERQLGSINLEGGGRGSLEVEGCLSNRVPVVTEVRLRFNGGDRRSPVTIGLHDLQQQQGTVVHRNELVARVNTLTFRREPGQPRMHVTIDSLNRKDAGGGLWQNILGGVKGMAVNLFIPPVPVEATGHQALLDFGLALAAKAPEFTFPRARNLKNIAKTE